MLNVLSIQSDVLGNRVYCNSLRRYFATYNDIDLTSCWYGEGRSLPSKVINRIARLQVPFLTHNRDLRRARGEWGYGYVAGRLAERKLAERPYDLLHFHTQVQALGSVPLMRGTPTVVSIDMTAYQVAREAAARYRATYNPNITMESRVFRAAAHVVTFSDWARRSVIEEHGLPTEKVTTVYPGARLDALQDPIFEAHARPRILFVGGDFQRKGGADLLQVYSDHLAGVADLDLVTGHPLPPQGSTVRVHAGVAAYSERWHSLFRNADIFVLFSYADAFPNVFQEAAGYGLALVGTDVGGIPEMIVHGENGYLVKPGDRDALAGRLLSLIVDPQTLLRMRRRSREIASERFDAAQNFRKLADLFQRVAKMGA